MAFDVGSWFDTLDKECWGLRALDDLWPVGVVGRFGCVESKPINSGWESGLEEDLVEMKICSTW